MTFDVLKSFSLNRNTFAIFLRRTPGPPSHARQLEPDEGECGPVPRAAMPPSRWSPGTTVDHTMLTAHDAVLGPAGRGHTPRLLQRLPLCDAAGGGGGSRTGRLLLSLLYSIYLPYFIFIIHYSLRPLPLLMA